MASCPIGNLIDLGDGEGKSNEQSPDLMEKAENQQQKEKVDEKQKLCGYLTKISSSIGIIKSTRNCWFEFDEGNCELLYYRQPPTEQVQLFTSNLLGKIPLASSSLNYLVDDITDHVFTITTLEGSTHTLKANDRTTLLWWLQELQKKRRNYDGSVGRSRFYDDMTSPGLWNRTSSREEPRAAGDDQLPLLQISDELIQLDQVPPSSTSNEVVRSSSSRHFRKIYSPGSMGEAIKGIKDGFSRSAPIIRNKLNMNGNELKAIISEKDEEIQLLQEKLTAREESMDLLKREFNKIDCSPEATSRSNRESLERDELRQENAKLKEKVEELKEELSMMERKMNIKDEIVIQLNDKVSSFEKSTTTNHPSPTHDYVVVAPPSVNVTALQDNLEGYILQNRFLNNEIMENFNMKKIAEQKLEQLQGMLMERDAQLYALHSKFIICLADINQKRSDGFTSGGINLGANEQERRENIKMLIEEEIKITQEMGEKRFNSRYDEYGFRRYPDDDTETTMLSAAGQMGYHATQLSMDMREYHVTILEKWNNHVNTRGLQRSYDMKELIRVGIPSKLRSQVWSWMVKDRTKLIQEVKNGDGRYYEQMLHLPQAELVSKQIELDLRRTMPHNRHFNSPTSDGIDPLRRVLRAYSNHNPVVSYCQGLNRIAAIALLFMSEEDAFWCLIAVIECIMPEEYYSDTLIASQADQRAFRDLLAQKMPALHRHLLQYEIDTSLVTFNWFMCIFCDNVPPHTTFLIWDSFLYEGAKVLFRYALAFFKKCEEDLLKIDDYMAILDYLKRATYRHMSDSRSLTLCAFKTMNPLSKVQIERYQKTHRETVQQEIAKLEQIRREYAETESIRRKQTIESDGDEE